MKFDTGAINTVISLKRMVCGKEYYIKRINKYIADRGNVIRKIFFSASGHELIGYLCKASFVEISGSMVNVFYYYLILDGERDISLLGNDFISACDFNHKRLQSIRIDYFDEKAYVENFENQGVLTLDELSDIINNPN
jgi:hypothetical protein